MSRPSKQEWLAACCAELARLWRELADASGAPNRLALPIALRLWSEHMEENPVQVASLWKPPRVRTSSWR
jgi:hypothetical protein